MEDGDGDGVFGELRALLFTIAYEIVGTAAEAEDVVQETYLRWRGEFNAAPAMVLRSGLTGACETVLIVELAGDRIANLYAVRNPDKLRAVHEVRALRREQDVHRA